MDTRTLMGEVFEKVSEIHDVILRERNELRSKLEASEKLNKEWETRFQLKSDDTDRQNAKVEAMHEAIKGLPEALYDCGNIMVMGDGCSTRSRDTWLIKHAIEGHLNAVLTKEGA